MAEIVNDCYFYLNSSCTKGPLYPFRHSEGALRSETVWSSWRKGRHVYPHSKSRHMEIQEPRGIPSCFWENQPVGCVKISCCFHHSKPRCINGLFLPPSGNSVSKTETQEGIVHFTLTEVPLKNAESISRPIHPPLIIIIDLNEEEDWEHEADKENWDSIPRTKTPEEIEEERAIREMCCKSGEFYKLHVPEEVLSTTLLITSALENKLLQPMETRRDLQDGDGLAVPTILTVFGRQGKLSAPNDGKAKLDRRAFEKGGGDCYVPRRNLFAKLDERKALIEENIFMPSKRPDARGKYVRKTFKKRFCDSEHHENNLKMNLDSQRPSSTLPRGKAPPGTPKVKGVFQSHRWNNSPTDKEVSCMVLKGTVKSPHSIASTPTVSPTTCTNSVSMTKNVTTAKSKENPSAPVKSTEPATKQSCKRVRKKQGAYEDPKNAPQSPARKDLLIQNPKGKVCCQGFEERNYQNKKIQNPYHNPVQKGFVKSSNSSNQKCLVPNKSTATANVTSVKVSISAESTLEQSTKPLTSMSSSAPRWRKRIQPTVATSKMDKPHNDDYNKTTCTAPAWRKRISNTKTDLNLENMHTERRRNGSK